MIGRIDDPAVADFPGIPAGLRVPVHGAKIVQTVDHVVLVPLTAELPGGHGVVEDEAARGYERPQAGIENVSVIHEAMKEATRWIEYPVVVERQGVTDMLEQEVPVPEIDGVVHARPFLPVCRGTLRVPLLHRTATIQRHFTSVSGPHGWGVHHMN